MIVVVLTERSLCMQSELMMVYRCLASDGDDVLRTGSIILSGLRIACVSTGYKAALVITHPPGTLFRIEHYNYINSHSHFCNNSKTVFVNNPLYFLNAKSKQLHFFSHCH